MISGGCGAGGLVPVRFLTAGLAVEPGGRCPWQGVGVGDSTPGKNPMSQLIALLEFLYSVEMV